MSVKHEGGWRVSTDTLINKHDKREETEPSCSSRVLHVNTDCFLLHKALNTLSPKSVIHYINIHITVLYFNWDLLLKVIKPLTKYVSNFNMMWKIYYFTYIIYSNCLSFIGHGGDIKQQFRWPNNSNQNSYFIKINRSLLVQC